MLAYVTDRIEHTVSEWLVDNLLPTEDLVLAMLDVDRQIAKQIGADPMVDEQLERRNGCAILTGWDGRHRYSITLNPSNPAVAKEVATALLDE